ncbi:hypothetical protein [Altererythrobacter sp. Root672]|uniref:hypothetical protein n=1 Tax=Altererythrobacter sp. Root672 TaxID=1736584 RepID=UPI0006F86CD3|nr:hypothetical protein [Altererythrobacter sp. Root672]KRA84271.1 hypothetical protein ASD76_09900 [Altererythrobacter sp. Root672]
MRRALHLLLLLAVLWCGIHVGEPAMAHDETLHHQLAAADDSSRDAGGEKQDGVFDAAHVGHHHCPMAPACNDGAASSTGLTDGAPVFAAAVAPLASLSQAPPLEPPAA